MNNSAYTNAAATIALSFATEAAGVLGKTADAHWAAVAAGLARDAPKYCEARPGTRYRLADGFSIDAMPYSTAKLFGERACRAAAA